MVLLVPEVSRCSINSENDVIIQANKISKTKSEQNDLSQLSYALQLSLDTDKVLHSFFKHIKHKLKLTKLLYINKQHDLNLLLGSSINNVTVNGKHIKKFELYYQNEYLGEINFASKHKFTPNTILNLKNYLNYLILPLKNTLLYNQAIKATRVDALTQLNNRLCLIEDLNYHFNLSKRFNSSLSLIFIDIDYFKNINDKYGHIIGDKVLIKVSEILKLSIRKSDILYRFGGEEFIIILENTNQKGALNLAKKLNKVIKNQKILISNKNKNILLDITISLGVATKTNKDCPESLMARADKALYAAKDKGRDQFVSI